MGDTFGAPSAPTATATATATGNANIKTDLFELGSALSLGQSTKPGPPAAAAAAGTLLDGFLGESGGERALTNGAPTHAIPSITVLDKCGVKVVLTFVREPASDATRLSTLITAQVSNASVSNIEQFVLQAAVPKQFQLQMLAPSGLHLPANSVDSLTQPMRIASPPQVFACSTNTYEYSNFQSTLLCALYL